MSATGTLDSETLVREPDRELVQRAQRFEPEALAEAFDSNFERIYSFVFAAVGDEDVAEDLTGQVFVKALDALPGYRLPGPGMTAFLYRIAQAAVAERLREQGRRTDQGQPPADRALHVRRALGELGDATGKVLMFRFLAGMDSEEIAHITGYSHGRVLALQHHGLKVLRTKLERGGLLP